MTAPSDSEAFKTKKFGMITLHLITFGLVLAWLLDVLFMFSPKQFALTSSGAKPAEWDLIARVTLALGVLLYVLLFHPFQVWVLINYRRNNLVAVVADGSATLPFIIQVAIKPESVLFWFVAMVHVLVVVFDVMYWADSRNKAKDVEAGGGGPPEKDPKQDLKEPDPKRDSPLGKKSSRRSKRGSKRKKTPDAATITTTTTTSSPDGPTVTSLANNEPARKLIVPETESPATNVSPASWIYPTGV